MDKETAEFIVYTLLTISVILLFFVVLGFLLTQDPPLGFIWLVAFPAIAALILKKKMNI